MVGDVEILINGVDGKGYRQGSAAGYGRLPDAQRAGFGVGGVGLNLSSTAGSRACGTGYEDIVDGDDLAGRQEGGHD